MTEGSNESTNSNRPTSNLIKVITIINGLIGLLLTLTSFIPRIKDLIQDTQKLHFISIAGFILFVLGILLFTFKERIGQVSHMLRKAQPWISIAILFLCSCLFFFWVGTWATQEPGPVITENGVEPPTDGIEVVSLTSPIPRGSQASITIKTAPNIRCTIAVYYESGKSEAQGLEPKNSDKNGNCTWSWRVGGNTTLGDWKIVLTAEGAGQIEKDFTVTEKR